MVTVYCNNKLTSYKNKEEKSILPIQTNILHSNCYKIDFDDEQWIQGNQQV